jgi:hypothetical protein
MNSKIKKFLPTLIIMLGATAFATSSYAAGDDAASDKWFVEGRYQKSISESTGFTDKDPSNTKVISATGEKFDNLDSAGFSLGKSFNDGRSSLSIGYESFGTVNKSFTTATQQNGVVISNVVLPMDITNIMVELGYQVPISQNLFAVGLVGLGQATIDSKTYSAAGFTGLGTATEVTNTSTRLGIGVGYKLSATTSIIGLVQQSDYGDATLNLGTPTDTNLDFDSEVNATEASIRLRVSF